HPRVRSAALSGTGPAQQAVAFGLRAVRERCGLPGLPAAAVSKHSAGARRVASCDAESLNRGSGRNGYEAVMGWGRGLGLPRSSFMELQVRNPDPCLHKQRSWWRAGEGTSLNRNEGSVSVTVSRAQSHIAARLNVYSREAYT